MGAVSEVSVEGIGFGVSPVGDGPSLDPSVDIEPVVCGLGVFDVDFEDIGLGVSPIEVGL